MAFKLMPGFLIVLLGFLALVAAHDLAGKLDDFYTTYEVLKAGAGTTVTHGSTVINTPTLCFVWIFIQCLILR